MKVVTVIGARPQFVKAAPLCRELRQRHEEVLVHTGQHYDHMMSGVFFEELGIPVPDINLGVGSGSHGSQTGAMLEGIEQVLLRERPDWLLIFGDTNSTLAGALAAAKLEIPIAHVEAGLRSFNRSMPEEVNRVVADHLSSLLLCPSATAVENLSREGITKDVVVVGDIMSDTLQWVRKNSLTQESALISKFGLARQTYLVCTVHRSENADDAYKLGEILAAMAVLQQPVIFPVHPRTRRTIDAAQLPVPSNVRLIEPLGYADMMALVGEARMVLTDSGGLQKEAYWLKVPCITLRDETEWVETVRFGWNVLVGTDAVRIVDTVRSHQQPSAHPPLYGDGAVAAQCVGALESRLGRTASVASRSGVASALA